jgi:hypothetical protein
VKRAKPAEHGPERAADGRIACDVPTDANLTGLRRFGSRFVVRNKMRTAESFLQQRISLGLQATGTKHQIGEFRITVFCLPKTWDSCR